MTRSIKGGFVGLFALALVLGLGGGAKAGAEFKVPGSAENSFIKIGLLAQSQFEWTETHNYDDEDLTEVNQNLFLRRIRILIGGSITPKLSFFVETDSANLGKYVGDRKKNTGVKNAGDVYIQDVILTYAFADEFKIDAGMLLIPNSYNSETSAATLLPVDYGPFSFLASTPTDSRVGRDYGVQARGYLWDKRLEYRAGIFQGNRDPNFHIFTDNPANVDNPHFNADAPFRYTGRLMVNVFEPQTSFFYTGATLGKKQILAIGGGFDGQDDYRAYNGDIFWDQPVGNGDAFTFQGDYIYFDGGETFPTLPGQNTWLFESMYYIGKLKLGPFGQYAIRDYTKYYSAAEAYQDETRYQAGLAYWADGHNFSLKLAYGYTDIENRYDTRQWVLQCEVFDY
jgi:hypothetical protein